MLREKENHPDQAGAQHQPEPPAVSGDQVLFAGGLERRLHQAVFVRGRPGHRAR